MDIFVRLLGGAQNLVLNLQTRKPRKQSRVTGWELRRQLRSPCWGCSMVNYERAMNSK